MTIAALARGLIMAKSKLTWLTTEEVAAETGTSRTSAWRACRDNPGFAVRLGGTYRIPPEHLARVLKGETPAQIAAEVRSGNGANRAA